MELPSVLREAIQQTAEAYDPAVLRQASQAISQRYATESGQGKRLVTRQVEAATYAAVRMPATFGAVAAALQAGVGARAGEIQSVLDVGAGTGAGSWAAAMVLPHVTYTCVEREPAMIELGKRFSALHPALQNARWVQQDFAASALSQRADLVVASYALNELTAAGRDRVLENLWQCTHRMLLLIEPGTPEGFRQLRSAKTMLTALGGQISAPCPHSAACPLPSEDWCHFTVRVARSRLHKLLKGGEVPYEDEKFSYLAVWKTPVTSAPARVLRHPLKEPGKITLQLCGPDGLQTAVVTKKHGAAFKTARKAVAGDAFTLPEKL